MSRSRHVPVTQSTSDSPGSLIGSRRSPPGDNKKPALRVVRSSAGCHPIEERLVNDIPFRSWRCRWLVAVVALVSSCLCTVNATESGGAGGSTIRHVSHRIPQQGPGPIRELAVERAPTARSAARPSLRSPAGASANTWQLQSTLPNAVIHDLAFASAQVGYAAAEAGQVWKTADGGTTWTQVMNLGFPYYWYGVYAFTEQDLVVSGFNTSNSNGLIRWSHDGGQTWSDDVVLTVSGWSTRVAFADDQRGLVVDLFDTADPTKAHYTTNGGATAADWTSVVPDADPGTAGLWGGQFSLLPSGRARVSGLDYCDSPDAGATWTCGPSVDVTFGGSFDGVTFFVDDSNGWVGGGEIAPDVKGWVHRTTDGGATWTDRTLDAPAPIRAILFVDPDNGWAVGGNIYSGAGAIYYSGDGGRTWSLDQDTHGHEMSACARADNHIWCAGYDSAFSGVIYKLDFIDDSIFANGFDG